MTVVEEKKADPIATETVTTTTAVPLKESASEPVLVEKKAKKKSSFASFNERLHWSHIDERLEPKVTDKKAKLKVKAFLIFTVTKLKYVRLGLLIVS